MIQKLKQQYGAAIKDSLTQSMRLFAVAGVIAISGVLLLAASPLAARASAVATPKNYLSIYSQKGTYTKVRISFTSAPDDTHSCGGTLKAGNSYTVTKKLYKNKPLKIKCSAVGGSSNGNYYKVEFRKGTSTTWVLANNQVDVNSGKCTVVHPGTPTTSDVQSTAACGLTPDTITKHDTSIRLAVNDTTNVSFKKGISGTLYIDEVSPWDGDSNVSKYFCTGTATITYTQTSGPSMGYANGSVNRPLTYQSDNLNDANDHCRVKLGKDGVRLNAGSTYTVTASFGGNAYFNAPATNNVSRSFTTR